MIGEELHIDVSGDVSSDRAARRAELGAFLRSRRARLRPADVGLPADQHPGRRRTPGLRREEVAELSGVGVTWYTWLEQGRNVTASEQVIDALARALRLDPAQHRHLRTLAGLATDPAVGAVEVGRDRLQRLVDAAAPSIASVYDVHLDYVVWNDAYRQLRHDPATLPEDRRNLLWMMFTDAGSRTRLVHWEPAARAVLGQFRAAAGRRPADPRFAAIVAGLTTESPEFRLWWTQHPVREFRPATITVDHPAIGPLELEMFQLRPVEHPELLMVVQVPATPHDRDRVAAFLQQA
jgi:transcriptional regulator with XRE-family HTH domain